MPTAYGLLMETAALSCTHREEALNSHLRCYRPAGSAVHVSPARNSRSIVTSSVYPRLVARVAKPDQLTQPFRLYLGGRSSFSGTPNSIRSSSGGRAQRTSGRRWGVPVNRISSLGLAVLGTARTTLALRICPLLGRDAIFA